MQRLLPHIEFARWVVFSLVVGWPSTSHPQTQTLPFQNLTLGKGQDINMVNEILQDRQGFMWFGTHNGLVRYDGYRFRHYAYDPETRHPMKARAIRGLLESPAGNIWMVSGQMLLSYNPRQDSFYHIKNLGGKPQIGFDYSRSSEVFLQDSSGNLWLRSLRGVFRVRENAGSPPFEVRHYRHEPGDDFSLSSDTVHVLLYDSRHRLWVGSKNGLHFYDQKNDRMVRLSSDCSTPIVSLCETESGKICVGTNRAGLCAYDPETDTFERYLPAPPLDRSKAKNGFAIAGKWVRQIARDGMGNIWLLAGNRKTQIVTLQRFDPESGEFRSCFEPFPPKGLRRNSIAQLFVDRAGFLWLATGAGLKRFDPYREVFDDIVQQETYLKDWMLLFTFYEDPSGILWLGTVSRGVLKYAPTTDKFRYYPPPDSDVKNIEWNFVKPIFEDSRGYLWVKTPDGTDRFAFDENDEPQQVSHFPFHPIHLWEDSQQRLWMATRKGPKGFDVRTGQLLPPLTLPDLKGRYYPAKEDREGQLWAVSLNEGVKRYNPYTGETVHFKDLRADPIILEDEDGNLWFNGRGGLKKYDLQTGEFAYYLKGMETVHSIWGKDGIMWVTTTGHGLFRFDTRTGESKRYSPKNGFPTLRPISIFKDGKGDLWMSSDVGVIHFNPDTETARLFDESDGLPNAVFSYGSCQLKNGEFFFPLWEGGFVRFHPDSLRDDTIPPRPAIVDFQLSNRPVEIGGEHSPLSQTIWATEELVLCHDQNNFTLGFTAFHYAAPEQNQFRFKMEGIDPDWNDPGGQRSVNFAGLSPGDYTFHLKAANHDGLWSEPVSLKITVLPPWWATWWAYCLYALVVGGVLYTYYRLQLRRRLAEAEAKSLREQFASNGWFRLMQNNGLKYHDDFLKKLNRAMEANYANENIDIPHLCEAMHMSRAHLYRKVKELTGNSVGQVLRSYRMRRAKALLETTDLTVSQVALEVGFKHLAHFSRSFQQEFGVNPSEVRK